ncbi:MAG: hypothetical protein MUE85_16210 [Microscillaceae bacterium]|nr:hypothetical protein [Microscillaceae bacterium]
MKKLFDSKLSDFQEFTIFFTEIIKEKVTNTIQRIDTFLKNTASNLKAEVEQIPTAQLKELLIQSKFENKCGQILKQLENINKFRPN